MNPRLSAILPSPAARALCLTASLTIAACPSGALGQTVAGSTAPRIVGGKDATIEQFPWQVALMIDDEQVCGGSILDKRWVLSAAHCQDEMLTHVRAGVTNKTDAGGQDVAIRRQIVHPDYVDDSNDLMLLELAADLDLASPSVRSIRPMSAEEAGVGLQDPGVVAIVTGWGALSEWGGDSDVLQQVAIPIVSNAQAARMYDLFYGRGTIDDTMIAAGYARGGRDACRGDSGGPLIVPDGANGYRLAGVTSWGHGCAVPGFPGIYARVSAAEPWIMASMGYTANGERLFDWAERTYPQWFSPPAATTSFQAGHRYRHYRDTGAYLKISLIDNRVYYLPPGSRPDDTPLDLGALEQWLTIAGHAAAPTQCLFDWAERVYPELFSPAGTDTVVAYDFIYRDYGASGGYLGLSSRDNHVYYRGPDGRLLDAGDYGFWMDYAGCPRD